MSKLLRAMVALSVLLSLGSVALGAGVAAHWGEEMDAAPGSPWTVLAAGDYSVPGYWSGGAYDIGSSFQPLQNQQSYTLDFRFKTAEDWSGMADGAVILIEQNNAMTANVIFDIGYNVATARVAHTAVKSGTFGPGYSTQESWFIDEQWADGPLMGDTWYLARVVVDAAAGTVNSYLKEDAGGPFQLLYEQEYRGPFDIAKQDFRLRPNFFPAYPSTMDYVRTYNGALDVNTALNAVPEPMSLVLLAVGGLLSLLRRRR